MLSQTRFQAGSFILGAALAGGAFFAGSAVTPSATGQPAVDGPLPKAAAPAPAGNAGAVGVSIPNGGAALVRGKDGYAYVVDTRGVFVKAAQSGKHLELP